MWRSLNLEMILVMVTALVMEEVFLNVYLMSYRVEVSYLEMILVMAVFLNM